MLVVAGVAASDDGACFVAGHSLSLVNAVTAAASKWRGDGSVALWPLDSDVQYPAAWHKDGDDYVILLF